MKRQWTTEELFERWMLSPTESALLADSTTDHTRLGRALLLKYFQYEGRFPRARTDIPTPIIAHIAHQLAVSPVCFLKYDWAGRTIKQHRAASRAFLHVREVTVQDADALVDWLIRDVVPHQRSEETLRAVVLERCRALRIEPPTADRIGRMIRSALAGADEQFCASVLGRLSPATQRQLDALLATTSAPADGAADPLTEPVVRSVLAELKRDPGPLSVETVQQEIAKLERIQTLGLPSDLFQSVSQTTLDSYRQRVVAEELHELRRHPVAIRLTLLAAYCWVRSRELTDTLAELLMELVQHISARAERRVEKAFLADLKRVSGKTNLLFQLAEAAVAHPDGIVRDVLYPVVSEQTLRDLVKEYRTTGSAYQQKVYTVMRGSYRAHYRRMVPAILKALTFHSNNAVHHPVIQALELLRRYADSPSTQPYFALTEVVPLEGVVRPGWRDIVVKRDKDGQEQINRVNYEISVLHALRERLRCKELWVAGAYRLRNPDEDLPNDFAAQRETYYAALHQPLDAEQFIADRKHELAAALAALDQNLPTNPRVHLDEKAGGRVVVSPLDPQPPAMHLDQLKAELGQRWPMLSLLDILKETDLRVHFTDHCTSATPREHLDHATLQRRLLLCCYG
jgi:hypothetical protein